jgi:hypothetical protein
MKAFLKTLGLGKLKRFIKRRLWAQSLNGRATEDIFTDIYKGNKWGDSESVSGPGSTLEETANLRPALIKLFKTHNIKTIIDAPCGDFHWFKEIDYPFEQYYGFDIVAPLIDDNTRKFGNDTNIFEHKNCLEDPLPSADMLFCRDLLLHLSTTDIFKLLGNYLRADIPLLLISHAINIENEDIMTGQGRLVNLTAPPFSFPEPETLIMENSAVFNGKYKDVRSMALWRKEDIKKALRHNSDFQKTQNMVKKAA